LNNSILSLMLLILFSCSMQSRIIRGIDQNNLGFISEGISNGEDINHVENNLNIPILQYAIRKSAEIEIIKELIQKGANVNAKAENGMTPLMYAVQSGRFDVVKLLLDSGALVNEQDSGGKTPLMFSADGENSIHRDIYNYLIRKRANPNLRDYYGNTVGFYDKRRLKRQRDSADYFRRVNSSYNYGNRGGYSYGSRSYGSSRGRRR
jgi:hypothetical protein